MSSEKKGKAYVVAPGNSFTTARGLITEGQPITVDDLKSKGDPDGSRELEKQLRKGTLIEAKAASASAAAAAAEAEAAAKAKAEADAKAKADEEAAAKAKAEADAKAKG